MSQHFCMHHCLYAQAPKWSQRPGWAYTESCTRQLPVAASDRHNTALISWPVTVDTHSRAEHREQAEHRQRQQGAAKSMETDEHIQDFCHRLLDKGCHFIRLPKRSYYIFTSHGIAFGLFLRLPYILVEFNDIYQHSLVLKLLFCK